MQHAHDGQKDAPVGHRYPRGRATGKATPETPQQTSEYQRAERSQHERCVVLQERAGGSDIRLQYDRLAVRPWAVRTFEHRDGERVPRRSIALSRRELALMILAAMGEDPSLLSLIYELAQQDLP